ncbi:MAG: dihydroxyacetone kinase subunit DhaL [Methylococcaceae bacterium]|nr:dihydroxyacetone kinase subunit DhaL [Methylococcaceae bacterium]
MPVSTIPIKAFIQAAEAAIHEHAEEVTELDQAIGDGDHVINLRRGLMALAGSANELESADWSATLQKIGMSLMSSVGGASGSLYATLFLAMSKAFKDREMNQRNLAEAFGQGVEAVKQRGKAELGEKTLLDVLIPVADTLQTAAAQSRPLPQLLDDIRRVAEAGCESTRELLATKGRASFLGERARGHIDPGARTSQLMIAAITGVLDETAS